MQPFGSRKKEAWPGMGTVLALLSLSVIWHSAAPYTGWSRVVAISLEGAALISALTISGETPKFRRAALVLIPVALILAILGAATGGEVGLLTTSILGLMIVIVSPIAIIRAVLRHPIINLQTVAAAVCIYLILGLLFAYILGIESTIDKGAFFAGADRPYGPDLLYFSFTTLTTTGYGDIAALTRVGRTTAIAEAMIGQLYLVTVLAILVSNLGKGRRVEAGETSADKEQTT